MQKYIKSHIAIFVQLLVMILLILGIVMSQGCFYKSVPTRTFSNIAKDSTITLFDQYYMEVWGVADTTSPHVGLSFRVFFIEEFPATKPIDSIPILVLDSCCFESICLDSNYCLIPLSPVETIRRRNLNRPPHFVLTPELSPPHDLNIGRERISLSPSWTVFGEDVDLPSACVDDDLTIRIVARLYDRVSNEVINREEISIPIIIKNSKRVLNW